MNCVSTGPTLFAISTKSATLTKPRRRCTHCSSARRHSALPYPFGYSANLSKAGRYPATLAFRMRGMSNLTQFFTAAERVSSLQRHMSPGGKIDAKPPSRVADFLSRAIWPQKSRYVNIPDVPMDRDRSFVRGSPTALAAAELQDGNDDIY